MSRQIGAALSIVIIGFLAGCRQPKAAGEPVVTLPHPAALPAEDPRPVRTGIPARPEEIEFPPLLFEPPKAAEYRRVLAGGVPVYLIPSREFPLIEFTFSFKGGEYLDSPGLEGLARATAAMLRRGGTASVTAEALDERFDFLAARASTYAGSDRSTATLNTLRTNLKESFDLFLDMLRHPRFQENRLALYKDEILEGLKQRNDRGEEILDREWAQLLYGPDHFEGRQVTSTSLARIGAGEMQSLHGRVWHPGNLIIGVSGDFEPAEMAQFLEKRLADWTAGQPPPDPAPPIAQLGGGVYHVEKDIPQGKVQMGMRAIERSHPDHIPLMVMNSILGGGGFTSRITNAVRSDEGLAYHAGSRLIPGVWYPGEFHAAVQSKNASVAQAISMILAEVKRIREQPVTTEELEVAQNSYIETFPSYFDSKPALVSLFIDDERTHRPDDWWQKFRERVRAVTVEDVQRVARQHLHPERMAIVVVGKWSEIEAGNARATMRDISQGKVSHLPLRDPLTLEPIRPE